MNRIQQKNLIKAIRLIMEGISGDTVRQWDNLFENGHNNANSVLCGLYREAMRDDVLKNEIRKNKDYMPVMLLGALGLDEKIIEQDKEIKLIEQGEKYSVVIEFGGEAKDHNKKNAQFAYNFLFPYMKK